MNAFFLVLFRPVKTFNELKTADKFSTMSLIVLLFLMLVNLILLIPITEKITSLMFSTLSLPEAQKDTIMQVTHKMRYLQVAGTTVLYLIMILFYTFLLYLFVRMAKEKLTYKRMLHLFVYSYFIVAIGDLVNTGLLYARGLDAITNAYKTSLTGLNLLVSAEQTGITLYTFLGYINPFQLIFLALLSIGLHIFTSMKPTKAAAISTLFWLVSILIPTMSIYFSQLTMTKSGVM